MSIKPNAFFDQFSEDQIKIAQETLNQCMEGFAIEAENFTRLAIMEEYIDYLYDQGVDLTKAKAYVTEALNKSIELFNCGDTKFIDAVKNYVINKYRPSRTMNQLNARIASKMANESTEKFMTYDAKVALESFVNNKSDAPAESGLAMAQLYVNKIGKDMIVKCFPDNFKSLFIK